VFFSDQWGLLAGAAYGLHRKPLPHSLILEEKQKEEDQQFEEEKRLLYVAITRARKMLVLGEGFSKQSGPWLQWTQQLFETLQPGAIEKAREGKTQAVRFMGSPVKVLPASLMNLPEQLEFTAGAILVGEPLMPKAPSPRLPAALDMTPSDLAALSGCFRFFHWTRMLGIAEPGRDFEGDAPQMRLGSVAHKILEHPAPPSTSALETAGLSDLAAVFSHREWKDLVAAGPERELPFIMHLNVQGKDCWIRGRMDAVVPADDRSGSGIPRVVDYKYAVWREGAESDYELQMTTYALALMKSLGTDRAIAELWYVKPPIRIIRRQYTLDEAEAKLHGLLSRYLEAVESDQWHAAERGYCDHIACGFRDRCWSVL
jgi:CRISPR/Cas system-associated exonuclease Cas4 (RecB family)